MRYDKVSVFQACLYFTFNISHRFQFDDFFILMKLCPTVIFMTLNNRNYKLKSIFLFNFTL